MRSTRVALISLIWIVCAGPVLPCLAEEFRIETDVFVNQAKEPAVQTLTIFSGGVVYDFLLTGVEEITVFDRDRNRLVLLDTKRKVKTELTLDRILTYVAQMKTQLSRRGSGVPAGRGDEGGDRRRGLADHVQRPHHLSR